MSVASLLPSYYTPQEVADSLKVTRRTVYTWISSGQLQANKAGPKEWRITRAQLDAFLSASGQAAASRPKVAKATEPKPSVGPLIAPGAPKPSQAQQKKRTGRRH